MLDSLGKEMCAGFIASYDPDYISLDNPEDNGRVVADCKVSTRRVFNPNGCKVATHTIWDAISLLADYGPNMNIDLNYSENEDEKVYIVRVPKVHFR